MKEFWIARDEYDGNVSTEICTERPAFKRIPEGEKRTMLSITGGGKRMIVTNSQLEWLFGMQPLAVGEVQHVQVAVTEVRQ
jgi:hypothetical protein